MFFGLKILKFFDVDLKPGSGIFSSWIRDGKIQIQGRAYTSRTRNIAFDLKLGTYRESAAVFLLDKFFSLIFTEDA